MIIALDRQHSGKFHRLRDMGAGGDFNDDGRSDIEEMESIWVGIYLLAAEIQLRKLGHIVFPISHGSYKDRNEAGNAVAADVYVAGHLNAHTGGRRPATRNGANYGAVFYDHRSGPGNGRALADAVAAELTLLPALGSNVRVWAAHPDGWTKNAYYTIKHVRRPISLCFEPAFIDYGPHVDAFFSSPDAAAVLGIALANGINNWSQAREVV